MRSVPTGSGRERRAPGLSVPPGGESIQDLIADLVPPPADKRPNRRGQQTRERLVQAAALCFSEYGYTHTRVADIVHHAGTAQGNFYRHFASLDEIFLAALQPALAELVAAPTLAARGGDEQQNLINQHERYLRAYGRNRHLLRVMREAAAVSPNDGFGQLWFRLRAAFVERTRLWLCKLKEQGRIGEADFGLLAEALGSLTEQMAYVHVGLPLVTPRPELIHELATVIGQVWYRSLPPVE